MAVDMFLRLGDIKGESKDAAHKDEIDILSWQWGCTQPATMGVGGGGGSGKVNIQNMTCMKKVDTSSTNLYLKCFNGKHYEDALLTVRKAGEVPVEYVKVTMFDVLVSSIQTGGSGGEDTVLETIDMNFAKVKIEYTPQNSDGSAAATMEVGWDIEQNTVM